MAQLRRTTGDDQHLYIKVGPSIGTKQVKKGGEAWLEKHGYSFPSPGGWVKLDLGDYRYLNDNDYLFVKGEDYTKSPGLPLFLSLLPPEAVKYGAPLLLQLADTLSIANDDTESWTLMLKLDEWEEGARDALLQKKAVAVGCYVPLETRDSIFSSISLRQILNAEYWPEVAPQTNAYTLYWQDSELYQQNSLSSYPLKEATPSAGLKAGWQGNVFFRFKGNGLTNTWKRYLPGMSISATTFHECYWIAQSDQKPEPTWPGKVQRIGQVNQGWQLWHLQTMQETPLDDVAGWLSHRQIHLVYPTWRLRLLNPLSIVSERKYTGVPSQRLLVRCDPPTQQTENGQANAFLSLTTYPKSTFPERRLPGSPTRSQHLLHDHENYLHAPAPPSNQKYLIRVSGEANGQSIWVQSTPLTTRQPTWLQGLHCILTTGDLQHKLEAFSLKPHESPYLYQLRVPGDFSLEELAQANWDYHPSDIPCSLHWEYLSPQGELCLGKREPILAGSALTNWWQTYIWPNVAESLWVKLTLDAASFGNINLMLVLKPEPVSKQDLQSTPHLPTIQEIERSPAGVVNQAWWTNAHYTANFFWMSRIVEREVTQVRQVVPPTLSKTLQQLCVPDMPAALKSALMLLATRRSMPVWICFRLQTLLADLRSASELIVEERR